MSTPAPKDRYAPGALVAGRYRVTSVLGRGGMGEVYRAEHIELARPVALKVLQPDIAQDPEIVARFLREARATATIGHPGIVEVFDLGRDGDVVFLAMELLEGEEFAVLMKRAQTLDPALVARIGVDLSDAVQAAHEQGVVHRDLKPQNVFLVRRGERLLVKVLDFGIAKLMQGDDPREALTRTGQVFGTPLYMSTEQLRGLKDVDARADVYAIGVVLYEALCREPPFHAAAYSELILKICTETPIPMLQHRPDLPAPLVKIVERAMHREREERFQSAAELRDALEGFLSSVPAELGDAGRPSADPAFAATLASTPGVRSAKAAAPAASSPSASPSAGPSTEETPSLPLVRPSTLLLGAAAALVLLAVTIGAWSATHSGSAAAEAEPSAPDDATSLLAAPAAPSTEATPAPSAPPVEDTPTTRRVAFDVSPSGVAVFVNSVHACDSPCTAQLPDEPSVMTFSRDGYTSVERVFAAPLPERVTLELEPAAPTKSRPRVRPTEAPPPLPTR